MNRIGVPAGDEAHVWFASLTRLASCTDALASTLSAVERRRIAGYRRPVDRLRRTLARGALRVLLAAYLGQRPEDVEIVQSCAGCGGPHGPLQIRGLFASLSYAPRAAAYAVAGSPVGMDVEPLPPRDRWSHAAKVVLPTAERAAIERLPEHEQAARLVAAWTIREAVGKAIGSGLIADDGDLERALGDASLSLRRLRVPGHAGAVAVAHPAVTLRADVLTDIVIM